MEIRRADLGDLDTGLEVMRAYHDHVLAPLGLTWDDGSAYKTIKMYIERALVFVAVEDGNIISMLAGAIVPHFFDERVKIYNESFWYSVKRGQGIGQQLLEAVEDYCLKNGVKQMIMANMAGSKAAAFQRFYKRKGYTPMEHHHIKAL